MQRQAPYRVRKSNRGHAPRRRTPPPPPKPCEIVETMTGQRRFGTEIFPSRKRARKALAKIIQTLPPRKSPDEIVKYYIRNV